MGRRREDGRVSSSENFLRAICSTTTFFIWLAFSLRMLATSEERYTLAGANCASLAPSPSPSSYEPFGATCPRPLLQVEEVCRSPPFSRPLRSGLHLDVVQKTLYPRVLASIFNRGKALNYRGEGERGRGKGNFRALTGFPGNCHERLKRRRRERGNVDDDSPRKLRRAHAVKRALMSPRREEEEEGGQLSRARHLRAVKRNDDEEAGRWGGSIGQARLDPFSRGLDLWAAGRQIGRKVSPFFDPFFFAIWFGRWAFAAAASTCSRAFPSYATPEPNPIVAEQR